MEYKSIASAIKSIEDRTVTGIAAVMGNIDDGSDRLYVGAFTKTLKERLDRVQHLWQHDMSQPPTAKIVSAEEVGVAELPLELLNKYPEATGGLQVVREYLPTTRGEEVLRGIVAGAIKEMSFGYDPIKFDFEEVAASDGRKLVRNLREVRLWDTSDVNWGMNAATVASKAAVPYKDTGKAPEDAAWSAPTMMDFTDQMFADCTDAEKRRIANHYAWVDTMPPSSMGDCKLPHHEAAKSGIGPAVWRGVAAAMGALMGSRGGVDIPSGDRKGVYTHLSNHYSQFDKEPPDFKVVELSYFANTIDLETIMEIKAGRVLSSSNLNRLKEAIATLQDILSAAEPQDDPGKVAALTASVLRKLALAKRDPILTLP